jgi:hypothetical protein
MASGATESVAQFVAENSNSSCGSSVMVSCMLEYLRISPIKRERKIRNIIVKYYKMNYLIHYRDM